MGSNREPALVRAVDAITGGISVEPSFIELALDPIKRRPNQEARAGLAAPRRKGE
jgi:hypothetical protein